MWVGGLKIRIKNKKGVVVYRYIPGARHTPLMSIGRNYNKLGQAYFFVSEVGFYKDFGNVYLFIG